MDLKAELQRLRIEGCFGQARELIRSQPGFGQSVPLQRLAYEHEDFWWAPIVGRRVTLRRRGPDDLAFVRASWADSDFMRKFNRAARPLPANDSALLQILARERAGTLGQARALHWTIVKCGEPVGFVSATDYSAQHRRCEFLVGMLRQNPSAAPAEASALAVSFLSARAGVERFTAFFYAENTYAAQVAAKFGFEPEGTLRGYIRGPGGARSDLLVAGLVVTQEQQHSGKKSMVHRIISRK
jgi:RimJ/RimL family protein N-acetyltransferase